MQLQDPTTQKLISWISTDIELKQKDLALCGPAVKYFYLNREQLVYRNGLLFYLWKDSTRDRLLLIVPESLKQEIMSLSHDLPLTGHMGIAKTLLRICMNYVWYRMAKDVELFVKSCNICNRNKKANIKAKAGLGQYHAGIPMERVHIDILGPFTPSDKGNQYVLMLVDQFTYVAGVLPTSLSECRGNCKVCGEWIHFQVGLSDRNSYGPEKEHLMAIYLHQCVNCCRFLSPGPPPTDLALTDRLNGTTVLCCNLSGASLEVIRNHGMSTYSSSLVQYGLP